MVTREQIRAADKRGKEVLAAYPKAVSATYVPKIGVAVWLSNGYGILINPKRTADLKNATEADLKSVEITGPGLGLHFPKIDVDLYVPALLDEHFMSRAVAASKLGAAGGKSKSKVKVMAARFNGMRGGRPRKPVAAKKKRALKP